MAAEYWRWFPLHTNLEGFGSSRLSLPIALGLLIADVSVLAKVRFDHLDCVTTVT